MVRDARVAGASINGPLEFEDFMLKKAFTEIRNDPQAYLRGTPGLAWRGIWELRPTQYGFDSDFEIGVLLPIINLSIFITFLLFIPYALINKNYRLAAVFVLPFGLYLFNTLFSHNIARLSYPMQPYLWLSALYFIFDGVAITFGRKRNISKHVN